MSDSLVYIFSACCIKWTQRINNIYFIILMVLLYGFACNVALATVEIPVVEVPASAVKEYYAKRGDTSVAARIAGVTSGQLEIPIQSSQFLVAGLSGKDPYICVRVIHANNLYRAEFSFRNPSHAAMVSVKFKSQFWSLLEDRIVGALAIRATSSKSNKCEQLGALLPAAWGIAWPGSDGYLLVNGGQADTVRMQEAHTSAIECGRLTGTLGLSRLMATAFTHVCPIRFDRSDCQNEVDIAVQRSSGPSFLEPDRLRFRLPCSIFGKSI